MAVMPRLSGAEAHAYLKSLVGTRAPKRTKKIGEKRIRHAGCGQTFATFAQFNRHAQSPHKLVNKANGSECPELFTAPLEPRLGAASGGNKSLTARSGRPQITDREKQLAKRVYMREYMRARRLKK